jgi:hypothetical protein
MKETIRKIIWDEPNVSTSAKEIAEMMTAFIKWVIMDGCYYFDAGTDNEGNYQYFDSQGEEITVDDIFNHWHTEIYKK